MRTTLVLALVLAGLGCQGISRFCYPADRERFKPPIAQAPAGESLASPAVPKVTLAPPAGGTIQPVAGAASLARTTVTPCNGEQTPDSLALASEAAPAPPGMVPARVQTTT